MLFIEMWEQIFMKIDVKKISNWARVKSSMLRSSLIFVGGVFDYIVLHFIRVHNKTARCIAIPDIRISGWIHHHDQFCVCVPVQVTLSFRWWRDTLMSSAMGKKNRSFNELLTRIRHSTHKAAISSTYRRNRARKFGQRSSAHLRCWIFFLILVQSTTEQFICWQLLAWYTHKMNSVRHWGQPPFVWNPQII